MGVSEVYPETFDKPTINYSIEIQRILQLTKIHSTKHVHTNLDNLRLLSMPKDNDKHLHQHARRRIPRLATLPVDSRLSGL
jgi:hypothetical protein